MKIVTKKISDLKEYDNNPRKNDDAVDYVAKSIEEFGFNQPIVVDKSLVVIAGHTRLAAAKKLDMETVPCLVLDNITEEQARAYRIMDNSSREFSAWDNTKLLDELESLQPVFPPEFFGMGLEDMERGLAQLDEWDFSKLNDMCVVTVKAPLVMQAEIRKRLEGLDGIEVEASHILI